MDSLITGPLQTRLREIFSREMDILGSRTTKSQAWLREAANSMPNGVPVSWMVGFYRHDPVVAVSGKGTTFTDLDGNSYRDFNLCDLSMAAGFAPEPIERAIREQAAKGNHFLLPTTDSLEVSRLLASRFGLPQWQYTLSATGANVDALRLARAYTGRGKVLTFAAKYHGHLDEMLWSDGEPESLGLPARSGNDALTVPFNDLDALRQALETNAVAAVLLEPVMTNCGLVMPQPGFHDALRALTREHGTLLVIDETHTQFAVYGGGTHDLSLSPDLVTGGKGIGGGVPVGVFGMTNDLAAYLAGHVEGDFVGKPGVPTGGTVYGNALSLAAARAGLSEVFTENAHTRVAQLGEQLQIGLQTLVDKTGLGFTIDRWGGRCQWRLTSEAPISGADGHKSVNQWFADARKVFYMNRGIWDAIATSGPAVSFAGTQDDVDAYLEVSDEFLAALTR